VCDLPVCEQLFRGGIQLVASWLYCQYDITVKLARPVQINLKNTEAFQFAKGSPDWPAVI